MRLLSLLLLLLSVAGCDTTSDGPGTGEIRVFAQDDGFRLETVEEYSCSNYRIALDVRSSRNELDVRVGGVERSDVCLTALGPAKAFVPIPDGASLFELELVLHKGVLTDRVAYRCGFAGCGVVPIGPLSFVRLSEPST